MSSRIRKLFNSFVLAYFSSFFLFFSVFLFPIWLFLIFFLLWIFSSFVLFRRLYSFFAGAGAGTPEAAAPARSCSSVDSADLDRLVYLLDSLRSGGDR